MIVTEGEYLVIPVDKISGLSQQILELQGKIKRHDIISGNQVIQHLDTLLNSVDSLSSESEGYISLPYPYNLLAELGDFTYPLSDDQMVGLNFVLNQINPRYKEVIYKRYKDELTLGQIGEIEGVSFERVRQLISRGCKQMRNPSLFNYIRYGYEQALALNGHKTEYEEMLRSYTAAISSIANESYKLDSDRYKLVLLDPNELSARAYNVLRRYGIDNLYDLSFLSIYEISKFRNCGKKTMKEIQDYASAKGLVLPEFPESSE